MPSPAAVEEALAAERRPRSPTFVEFDAASNGRTLVVGVPYSPQRLNEDLIQDFECIYELLVRNNWVQHFLEVQLVVPQPLMKVTIQVDDVRKLHANEISKADFLRTWRTARLGAS